MAPLSRAFWSVTDVEYEFHRRPAAELARFDPVKVHGVLFLRAEVMRVESSLIGAGGNGE